MAEEKKKRTRKAASTAKKDESSKTKKKTTMREQSAKTRANADKPKRVRKAANTVTKPVGSVGKALTADYNLHESDETSFLKKRRSLMPKYFRESWNELKQVTWPGRKETWKLVFAVFIFAIIMGVSIAALDYGLEKLLREVIL